MGRRAEQHARQFVRFPLARGLNQFRQVLTRLAELQTVLHRVRQPRLLACVRTWHAKVAEKLRQLQKLRRSAATLLDSLHTRQFRAWLWLTRRNRIVKQRAASVLGRVTFSVFARWHRHVRRRVSALSKAREGKGLPHTCF